MAEQQQQAEQQQAERQTQIDRMMDAGLEAGLLQRQQDLLHREYVTRGQEQKKDEAALENTMDEPTRQLLQNNIDWLRQESHSLFNEIQEISPKKTALEQEVLKLRSIVYPLSPNFLAKLQASCSKKKDL